MTVLQEVNGYSVVPTWINNEPLPVDERRILPVTNYSTSEVVHYYQNADINSCEAACEAAMAAFRTWKRSGVVQRRNLILKVADGIEARIAELARIQVRETSCADQYAQMLVAHTSLIVREIAYAIGSSVSGTVPPTDEPGAMSMVLREPIGPVLVIPPWNGPLVLALRSVCQVIAAGCTAVLKCSELSPLSQAVVGELFADAGGPPGLVNSLQASREDAAVITEALIGNPHIRKIDFIGSVQVGKLIAATAGRYLKPLMLELGGKNPCIICEDADLDQAAPICAMGAMFNHGQGCACIERIIVLRSVADQFIPMLVQQWEQFPTGMAVQEHIAQNALALIQEAEDKGAKILCGGTEFASPGSLKPTLVLIDPATDPKSMRIVDEESFGPSSSVYVVDTEEEAIALANRSNYGLTATVHSRNMERAIRIGQELECAQVQINSHPLNDNAFAPQGAVKGSGWGRNNGRWGFDNYLVEKYLCWRKGNIGTI